MLHCPHCGGATRSGAVGAPSLFAKEDAAEPDALAELTAQAAAAPAPLAKILRIIRDRLAVQDKAAALIERSLGPIFDRLMRALRELLTGIPGESVADRTARARLDSDVVEDLLRTAGLSDLIDDVADSQVALTGLTEAAQEAGGIAPSPASALVAAAGTAAAVMADGFWRDTVSRPIAAEIMAGLRTSTVGESVDAATARIGQVVRDKVPTITTEGRTSIAEFDRQTTGAAASAAGAEFVAYLGPVDRITRPFCATIADAVLSLEQVAKLNNAQTATSPLVSGGGYNCRHQFSPISETLAKALGLRFATDADVRLANARARKGR